MLRVGRFPFFRAPKVSSLFECVCTGKFLNYTTHIPYVLYLPSIAQAQHYLSILSFHSLLTRCGKEMRQVGKIPTRIRDVLSDWCVCVRVLDGNNEERLYFERNVESGRDLKTNEEKSNENLRAVLIGCRQKAVQCSTSSYSCMYGLHIKQSFVKKITIHSFAYISYWTVQPCMEYICARSCLKPIRIDYCCVWMKEPMIFDHTVLFNF